MNIRPIETTYAGVRFRSRLEARWAVFFDALGVKWLYELEGFELPSGRRYLPDFRLVDIGWFEVKPAKCEDDRWPEFANVGDPLYVAFGIPGEIEVWRGAGDWDHAQQFCLCACGLVTMQFEGRGERCCGVYHNTPMAKVGAAFSKALSMRFERNGGAR